MLWYHPILSTRDAELLLTGAARDGAFLLRDQGKEDLCLSLFSRGHVSTLVWQRSPCNAVCSAHLYLLSSFLPLFFICIKVMHYPIVSDDASGLIHIQFSAQHSFPNISALVACYSRGG